MNQGPTGNQASDAMEVLFGPDVQTASDRRLLKLCKGTGFIAFSAQVLDPFINDIHGILLTGILAAVAISALTFIGTLCLLGIRSAGRSVGKKSFYAQAIYVLARVTLYVFIPCAIITFLLIVW